MQAASLPNPNGSPAQVWFNVHFDDLRRRCSLLFRRLPSDLREEAEAEVLASIFRYVVSAAARGKLSQLTLPTLILYFGRLCKSGRKFAGGKSGDVLSDAARRQGHHVHSLSDSIPIRTDVGRKVVPLWMALADRREDSPLENTRVNHDYPWILKKENVGTSGRRVFAFLAEHHGAGCQKELAHELRLSPGRISQIKTELARSLSQHGYVPSSSRMNA